VEGTPAQEIAILPKGPNPQQNTINRAELAAIPIAIQMGATNIATDSLASMYQIRKAVRRPQDLLDHQHNALLNSIADCILRSSQPIHLYKVKGHANIIGNEMADEIAKAAAKGDIPPDECLQFTEPSNDRSSRYWPYTSQQVEIRGEETTIHPPLADLKESLKRQSHEKCHLGSANQNTTYFAAWKKIEHLYDHEASNRFMTTTQISPQERSTALKYRYGVLYTRKLAMRYGHAPDSNCLLCGQVDGGHHTASGCPALSELYTSRHNKVGRQIMTRVLRGRKGAFLIQMDIGSAANCKQDNITNPTPRNIPWDSLPPAIQEAYHKRPELKNHRPDGLLYKPSTLTKAAKYWIMEIKICRDTEPLDKMDQAKSQHKHLIDTIKTADPKATVTYCPLLVGVTGTIYDHTIENLEILGVKDAALRKCIKEIHITAIKYLSTIYRTKRQAEKSKEIKNGHS
jgi:ribonuclease HI